MKAKSCLLWSLYVCFVLQAVPKISSAQNKNNSIGQRQAGDRKHFEDKIANLGFMRGAKIPIENSNIYRLGEQVPKVPILDDYFIGSFQEIELFGEPLRLSFFDFQRTITFRKIDFREKFNLFRNSFQDDFKFEELYFRDYCRLEGNKYFQNVYFDKIKSTAFIFFHNVVRRDLIFTDCVFDSLFVLRGNMVDGKIIFKNCSFDTLGMFYNSSTQIEFQNCILPPEFKLRLIQPAEARMSFINCHAKNSKLIKLDVTGCDLNSIDMDYQNFRIQITDTLLEENKPYRIIQPEEKRQAYITLLENFQKKRSA